MQKTTVLRRLKALKTTILRRFKMRKTTVLGRFKNRKATDILGFQAKDLLLSSSFYHNQTFLLHLST